MTTLTVCVNCAHGGHGLCPGQVWAWPPPANPDAPQPGKVPCGCAVAGHPPAARGLPRISFHEHRYRCLVCAAETEDVAAGPAGWCHRCERITPREPA